jgi:hypothetical protein
VFATMRRKRRSTKMKNELGQGVDHFRRAASLAAQETSATVGPKWNAARGRMQPAVSHARGAATSSWDSALATITPLVAAATENVRQSGKGSKKAAKENKKRAQKNAKKLEKRANKAMGRKPAGRRTGKLFGLALAGAAVGAGAAYVVRRRKAAQWDEYDPSAPISSTPPSGGADDAAFEPAERTSYTEPGAHATPDSGAGTRTGTDAPVTGTADQTDSPQHSPTVARMASGSSPEKE